MDAANGAGEVSVRALGSRLMLHASMRSAGWIVVSETAWKGWRAVIGRTPIKLHFADRAFLGMYVPAGEHDIELSYLPKAVTNGAIASTATAAMLAIALLQARRKRRAHALRPTEQ